MSSGGAAAFKSAFLTPDLFGIAISYSGALVAENPGALPNPLYPLNNAEFWVPPPDGQGLIMAEPLKKGRYFLGVGEKDSGTEKACIAWPGCMPHAPGLDEKYNNFAEAGNKTFEALTKKGYQTRFAYGLDACHMEGMMQFHDLPNTLVWAWAEWKEKQDTDTTTVRKKKQDKNTTALISAVKASTAASKQPWPLVMQECTNGCCAPVCANCGKDTVEVLSAVLLP